MRRRAACEARAAAAPLSQPQQQRAASTTLQQQQQTTETSQTASCSNSKLQQQRTTAAAVDKTSNEDYESFTSLHTRLVEMEEKSWSSHSAAPSSPLTSQWRIIREQQLLSHSTRFARRYVYRRKLLPAATSTPFFPFFFFSLPRS